MTVLLPSASYVYVIVRTVPPELVSQRSLVRRPPESNANVVRRPSPSVSIVIAIVI